MVVIVFILVNFKGKADFTLTSEIEKEISSDTPINQRLRAIKDLSETVATNRLEDVSNHQKHQKFFYAIITFF